MPLGNETANPLKGDGNYAEFWSNHDLEESLFANNPWLRAPDFTQPLPWGKPYYWDTTVARKHDYWKDFDLPAPTRDPQRLRHDFREWGYCLIEKGLSDEQYRHFQKRLFDQAAGERLAGLEQASPYGQYINTLVNKGECFARAIEMHPKFVDAGSIIESLLDDILGSDWICHSFLANGADPGKYPQAIHLDQGAIMPWVTREAPVLVNTMFILQDVNEENGGTLIIPGSHKDIIAAGTRGQVGRLAPTINLEAPAGTVMVFDGRLLHGTGANRTNQQRFVATMQTIKPWMRQQENWVLSLRPEILASASLKLLHRLGFQALFNGGTVEGFGINFGRGAVGDVHGAIDVFRRALDAGNYCRVGELSPDSPRDVLERPYTLRTAMALSATAKHPIDSLM